MKGTNNYDGILSKKPDSASWNENRSIRKEVYVGRPNKDTLTASLVLYYSTQMSHISESLNQKADSIRQLKLFRIEVLTNEFYCEKDKQLWPAMKMITTLQEISVENPAEVIRYINNYKRMGIQGEKFLSNE